MTRRSLLTAWLSTRSLHTCSGGPRKCVGDQFAMMEAVSALAVVLRRFTFYPKPGHEVGMTTGATIHTQNGLYMGVGLRQG